MSIIESAARTATATDRPDELGRDPVTGDIEDSDGGTRAIGLALVCVVMFVLGLILGFAIGGVAR